MSSVQSYRMRPTPTFILIVAIFMAASGCATSPPQRPGPNLAPAQLPIYKKGTTYVYSNGSWETVIDVTSGAVTWKDNRGMVSTGSPDFTYKRTSWQLKSRQGSREFAAREDVLAVPPTSLWPLRVGNVAGYTESGTWSDKSGPEKTYRSKWSCEVAGTERVSVMAGEFDTYTIECARKSGRRTWEVKTWYYAPAIGHYVLVTNRYTYDQPSRRMELLAVLPPDDGLSAVKRNRIEQNFQKALEYNRSGRPLLWSDEGINVEITPTDTFRIDNGTYCRRYVQKISLPKEQDTFHGMACRESNGTWVIPRR